MATVSAEQELAAARQPIPVRRSEDDISKGLSNAVDRSAANAKSPVFKTSGAGVEGWDLPSISLAGIQTWLKLRTSLKLRSRLTAHLGLDLNPRGLRVRPVAALSYQLRAKDVDWAELQVTHQRAVVRKSWGVRLDRIKLPVSFTLNTAAGFNYQGRPDVDINVGDLKPTWLVGVAAVSLLALRKPLTGVKTFGDVSFSSPFKGTALGEVSARAQIQDGGLEIGLSQLNAVLRVPRVED